MQILEMPEFRKLAEACRNGYLSFSELEEQLEWCWDKKVYRGTRAPIVEFKVFEVPSILKQDR